MVMDCVITKIKPTSTTNMCISTSPNLLKESFVTQGFKNRVHIDVFGIELDRYQPGGKPSNIPVFWTMFKLG